MADGAPSTTERETAEAWAKLALEGYRDFKEWRLHASRAQAPRVVDWTARALSVCSLLLLGVALAWHEVGSRNIAATLERQGMATRELVDVLADRNPEKANELRSAKRWLEAQD